MSEIDKLDANGNPIPEDEKVTVPKKQYDEMVEKLASETQSKVNLVAEIKELREKKQLTEAEAEDLKKKLEQREVIVPDSTVLTPERIAEITTNTLRTALAEKDAEVAKANREAAMTEFLSKNKEFHPENDEGGLKLSALQRKLSRFNMEGLKTEPEFLSVLEDASRLVGIASKSKPVGTDPNPAAPMGARGGAQIQDAAGDNLSSKELQIIERSFGGDKERYIKIKTKRPDYVASLLQYSL